MTDLIEFLAQRIAEDEESARDAALTTGWRGFGDERVTSGANWVASYHKVQVRPTYADDEPDDLSVVEGRSLFGIVVAKHIQRFDPARVMRECAAKRSILAQYPIPEPQTDDELHRRLAHPDYEYEVFEYGRKTGADRYEPEGDGWEMFAEERFDYTEEERWRRLRPDGPRPPCVPVVLVALASAYSDHPDFEERWQQ